MQTGLQMRMRSSRPSRGEQSIARRVRQIEIRNFDILRRRTYLGVFGLLDTVRALLRCAEATDSGPDRISSLWCASQKLVGLRRIVKASKVRLMHQVTALEIECGRLGSQAGEGEAFGPARDGYIMVVQRDVNGRWSERLERVN